MSYKNTVNNETWTMRACYTTSISCALWLVSYVFEWSLASVVFLTVCAVSFFFLWFSEEIDARRATVNLEDNLWSKYNASPLTTPLKMETSFTGQVEIQVKVNDKSHTLFLSQDKQTFEPQLTFPGNANVEFPVSNKV